MTTPAERWRKRARGGLIALALLASLALPLAFGWFPQELVRRRVEGALGGVFAEARIGRLRVVPALLSIEVGDLHLADSGWTLDLAAGHVAVSAPALFGGPPALRSLRLVEPRLRLDLAADAGDETAATAAAPPFPVRIDGLQVSGGTVHLRLPGDDTILLDGIQADGSVGRGTLALGAARIARLGVSPIELGPAEASLRVSPALELELDRLEASLGTASQLRARGHIGSAFAPRPELSADAELELSELAALGVPSESRGVLTARLVYSAESSPRGVEAELSGRELVLAGSPVERVRITAAGSPEDAELLLELDALGGQTRGRALLRGARVENGRVTLSGIDVQALRHVLGARELPRGRLSGELRFAGPLDGDLAVEGRLRLGDSAPLSASAEATGSARLPDRAVDLRWSAALDANGPVQTPPAEWLRRLHLELSGTARGVPPPELSARLVAELAAELDDGHALEVGADGAIHSRGEKTGLRLSTRLLGGTLAFEADAVGAALGRTALEGDALDLGAIDPRLGGVATVRLDATGPLERLSGSGHMRIAELRAGELQLGNADVGLRFEAGALAVDASLPALAASGTLRASVPELERLEGELRLDEMPLAIFSGAWPELELAGHASASASYGVPLGDLRDAEARVELESLDAVAAGRALRLTRSAQLELRQRRLEVRGLAVEADGVRLQLDGSAGVDEDAPLDASAELAAELARVPAPEGWTLRGDVAGQLRLAGTRAAPSASGALTLTEVAASAPGLPSVELPAGRIELAGDAVRIAPLRAELAGGAVTLSGQIPLAALLAATRGGDAGDAPARLDVRWEGIAAEALFETLRPEGAPPLSASLAGEAHLEGPLTSLDGLTVELRGAGTEVDIQGLALTVEPFAIGLRAGRLEVESFALLARGERFVVSGSVGLRDRSVALQARGALNLRTMNPFLPEAAVSGRAQVDVEVDGSLDAPRARGGVAVSDGTLRVRALDQPLTGLEGRITFDGERIALEDVRGVLGGGDVRLSGGTRIEGGAITETRIEARGTGIALQYPEGFKSRLDAELTLAGTGTDLTLGGTVAVQRGLYDVDVALQKQLFAAVEEAEESDLLRAIALDVTVDTVAPILVRNNLARLEARGRLTARGNLDAPAPYGRLDILPGGKVFLQTREFVVDQGSLTYAGDFDPTVSIGARTQIEDPEDQIRYDVTIRASGSLDAPALSLSSTPSASERELISLISTGRASDRAMASGGAIAAEQVAAFLASSLTSDLSRRLQGIGIDEVSIQPQLLAREGDPTARFTFGKRVTDYANLIYSLGLGGPEERFIRLELEPLRNVTASAQRDDAGLLTYGFGQRIRFGAGSASRRPSREQERVRLRGVRLEGELPLPGAELEGALESEAGRRSSEWEVQDDAERLRRRLVDEGYLEAQVGARVDQGEAVFAVRAGPRYSWLVSGVADPPDLDRTIRSAFHEEEALGLGRQRLLEEMRGRGFLRAAVDARAGPIEGGRELQFEVAPGARLTVEAVRFPGAEQLSPSLLRREAGGAAELLVDPQSAVERIREAYRQRHFLEAEVSRPEIDERAGRVSIRVPVVEGPRARVAAVRVEGAPEAEPPPAAQLAVGEPFSEAAATRAAEQIRSHYLERGYPGADVALRLLPAGRDLEVVLQLSARERVTVGAVEVVGLRRSKESLVRKQVPFAPGDPLDPRAVVRAEARLLALGIFARAAIVAEGNPATLRVELEELPKFTAAYDVRYDDEDRLVGLVEGEAGNLGGSGLAVGARLRAGKDVREVRGSLYRPSLWRGGDLTLSVFRLEEEELAIADEPDFGERVQLERGVQLQQNLRLRDRWNVLYGYSFSKVTDSSPFFPEPLVTDIASFDLGAFRDSRDNALDPRRGRFYSVNLRLADQLVGSDTRFVKGFAQAFFNRALGPGLLWAHGYRLGLAHGFSGRPLVSAERFFSGGANSVRGFETNSLGPRDRFNGQPLGGEAVLVMNQELRWRHEPSGLGAVVFWDTGNVYDSLGDFDFDLRHSLGVGLRYSSPVGLLRLDWAFPLARDEGEASNRIHFSIGQAF